MLGIPVLELLALALAGTGLPQTPPPPPPKDFTTLSPEELMQIEVTTVSRTGSTVGQSAAAVFVIGGDMIRRSGAVHLSELFRMVPGMDVARIDANKWAISARGFNQRFGDKLLVQVDGRTVYNPLFSGVYWDALDYPLEDIDRIEVVRGPGASVWGANAVNGIINVITRTAGSTQGGFLSAGGGSTERAFGTLRHGGRRGGLDYRFYGKGFRRQEQFSRAGDPHDGWWGASGGARLDWDAGGRDSFTAQGDFIASEAERKDLRPAASAPYVLTNAETEVTHAGNLLARWSRRPGTDPGGSSWSVQAYLDRVARQGDRGFVDLRYDTLDLDFQHQLSGRRPEIVYGVGYRYVDAFLGPSTTDGGFAVSFPPPDRRAHLFSAFAQVQTPLREDRWHLLLGAKLEHNDATGLEAQPSARLLWTPSKRQSAWAAASRAVRTPTLSERGIGTRQVPVSTAPPLFPRLTGSPGFASEELMAYELGGRAQATASLSAELALFVNVYDGLRVAVPGAVAPGSGGTLDLPLRFENRMQGASQGAELNATWEPAAGWRFYGAYTLLTVNLRPDPSLPAGTRRSAESGEGQSPRHQVYLQSSWDWAARRTQLDLIGRYVSGLHGFNPGGAGDVIEGYVALDARVGWRPRPRWELGVVGQNLLDRHHPETGTAQFLRTAPVEIRRGVYAKATVRW